MNRGIGQEIGRSIVSDGSSLRSRLALGIGAAMVDALAVGLIVAAASTISHLVVYGHTGRVAVTIELCLFIAGLFVFSNMIQRRYRLQRHLTTKGQMTEAFNAWNLTMVAFIALAFLVKRVDDYSRATVVLTYLMGAPLITLARWYVVKAVVRASRAGHIAAQTVLLIGRASDIRSFVSRHKPWNMGIIIQDAVTLREMTQGAAMHGAFDNLDDDLALAVTRARQVKPDSVFIALPWSDRRAIERCIEAFMSVPVAIHLAPEEIIERFDNPRIVRAGSIPSLELTPVPMTAAALVIKRVFDVLVASLALVLLSPLFAIIALLIALDSKGPVFFLQRRYGFNQEQFRIIKFRTMRTMDDGDDVRQATVCDPRITRVGRWLRRYNLDELPQLVNVLAGQMSLVGPRPHALAHDREFEAKIARYARRHNVKPGITGWAQVNGFRGETDTDEKMAARVAHDLWYIDNWNFWLDLMIMVRTVFSPRAFRNAR